MLSMLILSCCVFVLLLVYNIVGWIFHLLVLVVVGGVDPVGYIITLSAVIPRSVFSTPCATTKLPSKSSTAVTAAAKEIASLGTWDGARAHFNKVAPQSQPTLSDDQALITSWRKAWSDDFPFYYVQIAPFKTGSNNFSNVTVRNSQRKLLKEVPKTGMVVISDISDTIDIHPKNKKSVGIRLANLAFAETYKTNNNLVNGPLFKSIKIDKNKVTVSFDYGDGLYFKDKNKCIF